MTGLFTQISQAPTLNARMNCGSPHRSVNRLKLIFACGLVCIVAPRSSSSFWGEFLFSATPRLSESVLPAKSSGIDPQDKKAQKRPPLIPPKRLVAVNPIEVKLTAAPAPSGFSIGVGVNNSSAQATTADGTAECCSR